MSDKVKLPKKVAEELQRRLDLGHEKSLIVADSYQIWSDGNRYQVITEFASDNFETFLQALVVGFEAEQTPEDKVREFYQMATDTSKSTIRKTLELLDKKIDGVNT